MDSEKIRHLYLEKGRTARQVGIELGLSKPVILRRLYELGIKGEAVKKRNLPTPRPATHAPYGMKIVSGKLVVNRAELRIARMIVEMRQRQNLPWNAISENLNLKGLKTRTGQTWKPGMTTVIFKRWKGKL